jgi:phosphoadenosine phosphosulfate reductase
MSEAIGAPAGSVSRFAVEELSRRLDGLDLEGTLRTAAGSFAPGRIAVVSAFGPASLVVLHELHRLGIRLPVIFVDTLHHFRETLEHVERVRERYDLDLRISRPAASRSEFEARYGTELWRRDLDRYQLVAKVEPFRRATADLDAWFTGRRRQQSATRADLTVVEGGDDQIRINPLAAWTRTDVWKFVLDHDVPYNPLHDQGYSSIGDEPLTTPVGSGEGERAGRWRGTGRTECGIHDNE